MIRIKIYGTNVFKANLINRNSYYHFIAKTCNREKMNMNDVVFIFLRKSELTSELIKI